VYIGGILFRYFVLLPYRLIMFGIGMMFLIVSTAIIGYIPEGR
jgi:hypothetical protein